jgi:hypothetical protein
MNKIIEEDKFFETFINNELTFAPYPKTKEEFLQYADFQLLSALRKAFNQMLEDGKIPSGKIVEEYRK